MSEYLTSGKIQTILPVESGTTKQGKEWKKLTFTVVNNDGYEGKELLFAFQIFGAEKVDNFLKYNNTGDLVTVKWNVQTNEYQGKYYTNLQAWRVDTVSKAEDPGQPLPTGNGDPSDDLPF